MRPQATFRRFSTPATRAGMKDVAAVGKTARRFSQCAPETALQSHVTELSILSSCSSCWTTMFLWRKADAGGAGREPTGAELLLHVSMTSPVVQFELLWWLSASRGASFA